ncbi:hypothetical protein MMPV_000678 [Pyropia vietnamensis]
MAFRHRLKRRRAPAGIDIVADALERYERQMRDAVAEPTDGKTRAETTWRVTKIHWQRNRHIYDLYHVAHSISRELYDWLGRERLVDVALLSKWRKPGYERLCSLAAIARGGTAYGTTGVCRVPLAQRRGAITPNVVTGCVSCASGDGGPVWWDDPVPEVVARKYAELHGEAALAASLRHRPPGEGGGAASGATVRAEAQVEVEQRAQVLHGAAPLGAPASARGGAGRAAAGGGAGILAAKEEGPPAEEPRGLSAEKGAVKAGGPAAEEAVEEVGRATAHEAGGTTADEAAEEAGGPAVEEAREPSPRQAAVPAAVEEAGALAAEKPAALGAEKAGRPAPEEEGGPALEEARGPAPKEAIGPAPVEAGGVAAEEAGGTP